MPFSPLVVSPMPESSISRTTAYLLLIVAMAIAAGNPVVGRAVIEDVPPMALTFWRFVAAAIALLPFGAAAMWRDRALLRRHAPLIGVLGVLGVGVYNAFLYLGVQTTTAINASLIVGAVPVAAALLTVVMLRETPHWRRAVGVALGFLGIVVTIARGDLSVVLDLAFVLGDLLMLISALGFASYSVLLRKLPRGLHPVGFMLIIDLVALAGTTPFYAAEVAMGHRFDVTPDVIGAILYVGVMATAVSFSLYNVGVAAVGSPTASQFVYLAPVFTSLMAVVFLGENLRLYHGAGIALIFAGIYLSTTADRRQSANRETTGP
ncbi:MAG: DMT family transporter [Alphaproteobacteria bacterium]|nr:DMT family transporter [Alphaproteobacteria bacterium]